MKIEKVAVLGCGLMGSGIAQVCARSGYQTVVWELTAQLADRGIESISARLARAVEKGTITAAERDSALGRIRTTTRIDELVDSDLIIEAVIEDLDVKNGMWLSLDELCAPQTIFASNTSSLSISDMAAAVSRPARMVGLHFFNPVPVMPLVEVVRTIATDPDVRLRVLDFAHSLGKETIECRDSPGFLVNLLLVPFVMDAIRALENGVASVTDIDLGMRLGAGHPMGPLTLCDFIGNDTLDHVGEIMYREYREKRYAPPPLLKRMVALGYHGRKTHRGFYDYSQDPPVPIDLPGDMAGNG